MRCFSIRNEPGFGWMWIALLGSAGLPGQAAVDRPSVAAALHEYVSEPRFQHAWWAVHTQSLSTGHLLFATNQHRLAQPASCAKLLIAALALDHFGSAHRCFTTLHAAAAPRDGTLAGDLVIRGSGDFSLGTADPSAGADASFDPLLETLRETGIRRITGGLVGDAAAWAQPAWGLGWAWDDLQNGYGAAASALSYGHSRVTLVGTPGGRPGDPCQLRLEPPTTSLQILNQTRTAPANAIPGLEFYRAPGSSDLYVFGQLPMQGAEWARAVSVPDAPAYFLERFRARLQLEGIEVGGTNRALAWPVATADRLDYDRFIELGRIASPPLGQLIRGMMAISQNQAAQILLLQVGTSGPALNPQPSAPSAQPASKAGLDRLQRFLQRGGISPAEVRIEEASGLARSARVSPAALVRLLQVMDAHEEQQAFKECLPVQQIDDIPAQVEIRAKTGTLSDVAALAGYLTTGSGERIAFAVMLNGYAAGPGGEPHAAVNGLVRILAAAAASAVPRSESP